MLTLFSKNSSRGYLSSFGGKTIHSTIHHRHTPKMHSETFYNCRQCSSVYLIGTKKQLEELQKGDFFLYRSSAKNVSIEMFEAVFCVYPFLLHNHRLAFMSPTDLTLPKT
jgi:hypothetical protein